MFFWNCQGQRKGKNLLQNQTQSPRTDEQQFWKFRYPKSTRTRDEEDPTWSFRYSETRNPLPFRIGFWVQSCVDEHWDIQQGLREDRSDIDRIEAKHPEVPKGQKRKSCTIKMLGMHISLEVIFYLRYHYQKWENNHVRYLRM